MKMIQIVHKTSVLRYRLDWLSAMEIITSKAAKGKSETTILTIAISEPGVFRSCLTMQQINKLNLGAKLDFDFPSVDEALAAVTTIEL